MSLDEIRKRRTILDFSQESTRYCDYGNTKHINIDTDTDNVFLKEHSKKINKIIGEHENEHN